LTGADKARIDAFFFLARIDDALLNLCIMPTSKEVEVLVIESVRLLAEDFDLVALQQPSAESALYGNDGVLDSMALVNLLADVEDAVSEQFGAAIALADEKAMSARHSPFLTIKTLAQAVLERIEA
jgi:acyl carrier protein